MNTKNIIKLLEAMDIKPSLSRNIMRKVLPQAITKARNPIVYKRKIPTKREIETLIEDSLHIKDLPPVKVSKHGIQPQIIGVKNGKITPIEDFWEGGRTFSDGRAAWRLQKNYENAMHRRRDYTFNRLKNNLYYKGIVGVKDPNSESVILDSLANEALDNSTLFHPTHFAPESLRSGAGLIKQLAESSQPTAFTVTPDLSPMLEKSGFIKVGSMPQIFNGELVMKDILLNRSTTKEAILNRIDQTPYMYQGFDPSMIDPLIETLRSTKVPVKVQDFQPDLNTFNISQLLKQK